MYLHLLLNLLENTWLIIKSAEILICKEKTKVASFLWEIKKFSTCLRACLLQGCFMQTYLGSIHLPIVMIQEWLYELGYSTPSEHFEPGAPTKTRSKSILKLIFHQRLSHSFRFINSSNTPPGTSKWVCIKCAACILYQCCVNPIFVSIFVADCLWISGSVRYLTRSCSGCWGPNNRWKPLLAFMSFKDSFAVREKNTSTFTHNSMSIYWYSNDFQSVCQTSAGTYYNNGRR